MADEIRIVRGIPTDEELAAIVGVLYAARPVAAAPPPAPTSRWTRSARPHAVGLGATGRDSWRTAGLPR